MSEWASESVSEKRREGKGMRDTVNVIKVYTHLQIWTVLYGYHDSSIVLPVSWQ